jgi:hypothetical protein
MRIGQWTIQLFQQDHVVDNTQKLPAKKKKMERKKITQSKKKN